jgi:hypothetical protein
MGRFFFVLTFMIAAAPVAGSLLRSSELPVLPPAPTRVVIAPQPKPAIKGAVSLSSTAPTSANPVLDNTLALLSQRIAKTTADEKNFNKPTPAKLHSDVEFIKLTLNAVHTPNELVRFFTLVADPGTLSNSFRYAMVRTDLLAPVRALSSTEHDFSGLETFLSRHTGLWVSVTEALRLNRQPESASLAKLEAVATPIADDFASGHGALMSQTLVRSIIDLEPSKRANLASELNSKYSEFLTKQEANTEAVNNAGSIPRHNLEFLLSVVQKPEFDKLSKDLLAAASGNYLRPVVLRDRMNAYFKETQTEALSYDFTTVLKMSRALQVGLRSNLVDGSSLEFYGGFPNGRAEVNVSEVSVLLIGPLNQKYKELVGAGPGAGFANPNIERIVPGAEDGGFPETRAQSDVDRMKPESETLASNFKTTEAAVAAVLKVSRLPGSLLIVHTQNGDGVENAEMSLMPTYNRVSLIIKKDHVEVSLSDRLSNVDFGEVAGSTRIFTLGKTP